MYFFRMEHRCLNMILILWYCGLQRFTGFYFIFCYFAIALLFDDVLCVRFKF